MHFFPKPFSATQRDGLPVAAFAALITAFLFGGASRLHELRLALTELSALPLLVLAIIALLSRSEAGRHRYTYAIIISIALLPLSQLMPLPPSVWERLPGRDQLVLGLDVVNLQAGWIPLSLTPDKTWRSFLALLPPVAMFLGVLAVSRADVTRRLVQVIIAATLISIVLGALQLASGGDNLYLWPTTDAGNLAGLFANRNHLATLCLMSMPFAAVLGAAPLRHSRSTAGLWLAVLYVALMAVALGIIRSRAGIILFTPVLAGTVLAAWIAAGHGRPKLALFAGVGTATVILSALGTLTVPALLDRFDSSGTPEGRFENWPIVAQAAQDHLPVGAGLGSFDTVYRSVEPLQYLDATFFNQAHNDYLEVWLEAGWFGAAILVAFLIWFGKRSWAAWTSAVSVQRDLQRAATIAIGAVLLHSAIDYPLRTIAIATVFAMCCGLLELTIRSDSELGSAGHAKRQSRRFRSHKP